MLGRLLALLAITALLTAQSARGADCADFPERIVLDAALDLDFASAERTLEVISPGNAIIPSSDFYRALLNWIQATTSGDRELGNKSTDDLQRAVGALKRNHQLEPDPDRFLAWHLSAAHTARILVAEKQLLTGYRLGLESTQALKKVVYDQSYRIDQRAAAALATGLYYVYLNYIPDEFEWIKPMLKSEGSIDQGRELIEFSIRNSPQFSPEAARSLFMEVPWTTPAQCRLLELAEQLAQNYPNNTDLSIVLQGTYLRCGHPDSSLDENERIRSIAGEAGYTGLTEEPYRELLELGRIRALAQSGAVTEIQTLLDQQQQNPLYDYALANALDVANQRDSAVEHYNRLVESRDTPEYLRNSAIQRLTIPYRAPETIDRRDGLKLLTCQG